MIKKIMLAFITLLTILASCKKDSDKNLVSSSGTIRFEVTGNYTGKFTAAYTTFFSCLTSDEVIAPPCSREINYASNVSAASIGISGGNGVELDKKVKLVLKKAVHK